MKWPAMRVLYSLSWFRHGLRECLIIQITVRPGILYSNLLWVVIFTKISTTAYY